MQLLRLWIRPNYLDYYTFLKLAAMPAGGGSAGGGGGYGGGGYHGGGYYGGGYYG